MNNNKQKVLISIDTEGPAGEDPITSLVFGKTRDGNEYGIRYLMKLFDRYGAKGLFFVDFAEAWDYGERKIESAVDSILRNGHDVGVHLHPDHMADKERRYLWQYSFEEQYEMISKCTELYEKIVGKRPLSFRAGRYGANNNTIRILNQLNYKYDMSKFYGNRYCKLNDEVCSNRIKKIKETNIIEVPVTSFRSYNSFHYSRFDKVDCSMDFNEFKRVINQVIAADCVDVVSLFVHSFSVLNWRKHPDIPRFSKRLNRRLVNQLEYVFEHDNIVFVSEKELDNINFAGKQDIELDISQGLAANWFLAKRAVNVILAKMIRDV